jgi:hypothetical protein
MIVADTLFTVSLIIVFILVIVPIAFWVLQAVYRGARGRRR